MRLNFVDAHSIFPANGKVEVGCPMDSSGLTRRARNEAGEATVRCPACGHSLEVKRSVRGGGR